MKPVLAVRAFWANPMTGKEVKGYNSTTVYGTGDDEPPILLRVARRIHGHLGYKGGTLPPKVARKYATKVG